MVVNEIRPNHSEATTLHLIRKARTERPRTRVALREERQRKSTTQRVRLRICQLPVLYLVPDECWVSRKTFNPQQDTGNITRQFRNLNEIS